MSAKYYTHFLLTEASYHGCSEFSGVVELNSVTNRPLEIQEIEELLARNFEVDADDVQVLHWSRLH